MIGYQQQSQELKDEEACSTSSSGLYSCAEEPKFGFTERIMFATDDWGCDVMLILVITALSIEAATNERYARGARRRKPQICRSFILSEV